MLKKIINKLQSFYNNIYNNISQQDVPIKNKLDKDLILALVKLDNARHIEVGVKVMTESGIAHIKEVKNIKWVSVSYKNGRWIKEIRIEKLSQYYAHYHDRYNDTNHVYPLSYADYEFIHPDWDEIWLEGTITNKKYFQISDQEKEKWAHLPDFNKSAIGRHILKKLEEKKIDLKFEHNNLISIKND